MRGAFVLLFALSACTYEWNGGAPSLPLVGPVPELSSFDKLNAAPVGRAAQMLGPDGAPWTLFCELWLGGSGNNGRNCKQEHLVRLGAPGDPATEEIVKADTFGIHPQMLYVVHQDTTQMPPVYESVSLHLPGDANDVSFALGGTKAQFTVSEGGASDVFVWWNQDPATTSWVVFRRDRAYERHVPIPTTVDPSGKNNDGLVLSLSAAGDLFFVRTPDGALTAYSTTDESQRSLGMRPRDLFVDDARLSILTIGGDGVREVPFDGSPERVLTDQPADVSTLGVTQHAAYFAGPGGLYRADLTGVGSTLVQPGAIRARAVFEDTQLVYGNDPSTQYVGGAGDGWLGDWNFMNRGRIVHWSADGSRVYFLENAATIGTSGDLTVANVSARQTQLLSINVHSYDELLDGRIVAVENAVQAGSWNRLVLIDQALGQRSWLVPEAEEFFLANGKQDLVVDVASGASGYDVLRIPAPSAK